MIWRETVRAAYASLPPIGAKVVIKDSSLHRHGKALHKRRFMGRIVDKPYKERPEGLTALVVVQGRHYRECYSVVDVALGQVEVVRR